MASEEIRRRIQIEMRSDTQGVADRTAEEIRNLKQALAALTEEYAAGDRTAQDYAKSSNDIFRQVKALQEIFDAAVAAQRGLTPALEESMVPLQALAAAGLKLQDSLEAAARRAGEDLRRSIEANLVPLGDLFKSGLK